MSLNQTLDLLLAQLDGDFYTPHNRQILQQLGRALPLVERGGFECRLLPADPVVDFQQNILRAEFASVQAHVRRYVPKTDADHATWEKLFRFLTWAQSQEEIVEIWMEYDTVSIKPHEAALPLPSLFVGFIQRPANQQRQTAAMLDCLFGRAAWQPWHPILERCFSACSGDVFVSHVGAMLSRGAVGCRINVKRLTSENVSAYLQAVGWRGESLPTSLLHLLAKCDRFSLALDVNRQVLPTIGFECIVDTPCQWPDLFDTLVECSWMTAKQAAHLQRWPGTTTPVDNWETYPEHHLIASLWRPATELSRFVRRISHVKLVYPPRHAIQSKAYLWFHHEWDVLNEGEAPTDD